MIAVIDANILARFVVSDDPVQERIADDVFLRAKKAVIPTIVFCELAWLMRSRYKLPGDIIAGSIRGVVGLANVIAETDEVEAGLKMLDGGGDFADGVIAYTGGMMAGEPSTFISFDKQAVKKLSTGGLAAMDAAAF
jgi:predicted nucleic-acid-binding protein